MVELSEHIAKIIQASQEIDEKILVKPGVKNNDVTCVE